jgi:quercetin dioxygenase-like cupin family protein
MMITQEADRIGASVLLAAAITLTPGLALAQDEPKFAVETVAEKALDTLPAGELFWHVETFATMDDAEAAATESGLPAEADGKAWLLTLGPEDMAAHGGDAVTTIGPIDRFDATQYLLRIVVSDAPPGTKTSVHSHPGSEAIYILSGEATIQWPDRTDVAVAGEGLTGSAPRTAMQAMSTGDEKLAELVMFVVDAAEPFSAPAELE